MGAENPLKEKHGIDHPSVALQELAIPLLKALSWTTIDKKAIISPLEILPLAETKSLISFAFLVK